MTDNTSNVTKLPTINEVEVAVVVDFIVENTDKVPNVVMLAAAADLLGLVVSMYDDNDRNLRERALQYAYGRAHDYAFAIFTKRAEPKPDNVTPLTAKPKDDKKDE